MKKKEQKPELEEQENMTPLTEAETESVSGGTNPFADAPRVKEKEIDDRLRDSLARP